MKFDKIEKTVYNTFEEYLYAIFDKSPKFFKIITFKTVHIHHNEIKIDSYSCRIITEKYFPRYLRCKNNINKFEISNNISENMKQIIKYFYVFDFGRNILFVTIDDKVFGMGKNNDGVCGLGHQNKIKTIELIPELCDKKIKQFFNGYDFVLGLTNVFSWGKNNHGQLGIGQSNDYKIFKPQLIEYFNNKTIVQVCCGDQHSAVLTSDNCVHLWGYLNKERIIERQIELELKGEIKSIHCSKYQSFCVTKFGKVYYWEENYKKMKCISNRLLINIQSMCSTHSYAYFISYDSTIYSTT